VNNSFLLRLQGALTIAADTGQELKALGRMSGKRVQRPKNNAS